MTCCCARRRAEVPTSVCGECVCVCTETRDKEPRLPPSTSKVNRRRVSVFLVLYLSMCVLSVLCTTRRSRKNRRFFRISVRRRKLITKTIRLELSEASKYRLNRLNSSRGRATSNSSGRLERRIPTIDSIYTHFFNHSLGDEGRMTVLFLTRNTLRALKMIPSITTYDRVSVDSKHIWLTHALPTYVVERLVPLSFFLRISCIRAKRWVKLPLTRARGVVPIRVSSSCCHTDCGV